MSTELADDTEEFLLEQEFPGAIPARPFSSLVQVDVAGLSDKGKVRPNNEDHFLIGQAVRYLDVLKTNLPPGEVPARAQESAYGLVVADGMGGVAGGELASRLAIRTLINLVLHVPDWIMRLNDEGAEEAMRRAVERYRQIDAAISREAADNPNVARMGTTMTVAYTLGADLFLTHVGDSRAYVYRAGQLRQLTRDQTVAQQLVELGTITKEQAVTHHLRHMLTSALGRHWGNVQIDLKRLTLADGDCLLLCSDGLTEMVKDAEITQVLGKSAPADETCRTLVDLALDHGGKDNVTVLVARYRFPKPVAL